MTLINEGGVSGRTHVIAPVHFLEAVQVSSESGQIFVLHVAEEVLDGQRGHLDGCGGVHVCGLSLRPLLEGQEAAASAHRVAAFSRRLSGRFAYNSHALTELSQNIVEYKK